MLGSLDELGEQSSRNAAKEKTSLHPPHIGFMSLQQGLPNLCIINVCPRARLEERTSTEDEAALQLDLNC
jgi:hypothetical protein